MKAHIKKFTNRLHVIKTWYLLVGLLIFVPMSVWQLRSNSLQMVKLRQAVIDADANGTDVEKPLQDLRHYVARHMNTNLRSGSQFATNEPPIQLVNRYNQAVREAQEKAAAANGNSQLYSEAEESCKQRSVPLTAIAQCIQDYIAARTNNANPTVAATIPKELYTYDFISPKWSPDLAGWSVLASGLISLMLLGRLGTFLYRAHLLRNSS